MKKEELKQIVADCCNDIIFNYNGLDSGITSGVKDYVPTFQVWHGDFMKNYDNIEDVMNDKIYSGKSISDLIGVVDFTVA